MKIKKELVGSIDLGLVAFSKSIIASSFEVSV